MVGKDSSSSLANLLPYNMAKGEHNFKSCQNTIVPQKLDFLCIFNNKFNHIKRTINSMPEFKVMLMVGLFFVFWAEFFLMYHGP